jgi:hypothetical protein
MRGISWLAEKVLASRELNDVFCRSGYVELNCMMTNYELERINKEAIVD